MAFAANPFSRERRGAGRDGQGMNPLLQNFYMIIHPPSLYTGFVGCTVPFAFAVAALVTGRLDHEWIIASRKWTLFAWMFLAIGNTLGALWAYESLGWGGYWGWDPVENAAFLPLLTASAFVHSVMIQERRGILKVWNVCLICLTFFLTIFGTFLTRSGAIASVHSFAQSSIGNYFVAFLGLLFVVVGVADLLPVARAPRSPPSPRLRKRGARRRAGCCSLCTAPGSTHLQPARPRHRGARRAHGTGGGSVRVRRPRARLPPDDERARPRVEAAGDRVGALASSRSS
jgi:cytochrome c-type biogenesis protein CcmF